jgi:RNA-directed DNA polymerase
MHENRETSGAPRSNQDRGRPEKAQSRNAGMHASEESDHAIVPMNQPNNGEFSSAEVGEGRAWAKENIVQSDTSPTQSGKRVSQGLSGVREAAKARKQERFTALLHHVTVDLLRDSFYALKRKAAPGVDGVTWQEYETGLGGRLVDLHSRVHRGAYRAQPSRRVYIPKADGRQRPLGVAALEDKIVQQAVVTVLNEIYEVDFKGFSYGFRPGRGPHQALDALVVGIQRKPVNWVLDARHSELLRQFESRMDIEVYRARRRRSPNASPDPEMVEGGSFGRWSMVGDKCGYASGFSGFAAARQCVPALRLRSVGRGLAQESREGRCNRRPICRRSGGGL